MSSGWDWEVLAEGSTVSEGIQKFGKYFARKGWFGFDKSSPEQTAVTHENGKHITAKERIEDVKEEGWNVGENGRRILVEVATAYAITKVLLPARVILSVWATPWFARNVLGALRSLFGRGAGRAVKGGAAGAGGRVMGKVVEK
ncbi:hypothetical protein D0Z07_7482 [Hyphodiscus hymeniophilus]|uniref:Uncharacterized protein n=1 Tax=Hyphodiscus hymeniophilus TaxID=353542 RepID=A0A9P6VEW9_9HELO|nr:hypothetical protein D0Z07_7482 [Hyphodiscus hymeniophilus]